MKISLFVELRVLTFQLVSNQRIGVYNNLMLLYFQYYETRYTLHAQCTERASHRTRVYEMYAIMIAEL